MRRPLIVLLAALTASCAAWRPIAQDGPADLRDGVFVVMSDRAVFVTVESIQNGVVSGTVRGGCLAGGQPLERAELEPHDTPERTCERLGWVTPSATDQPISLPLDKVVEARVYEANVLQSVLAGTAIVLLGMSLAFVVVVATASSSYSY